MFSWFKHSYSNNQPVDNSPYDPEEKIPLLNQNIDIQLDKKEISPSDDDLYLKLPIILNKLNTSHEFYISLKKIYNSYSFGEKICTFTVLTSSAIFLLKSVNHFLETSQPYEIEKDIFDQYIMNGTCLNVTIRAACSFIGNITKTCSDIFNSTCSALENKESNILPILIEFALFTIPSIAISKNILENYLCLRDFLESNELDLLAKFDIDSYSDINSAKKSIKIIMEIKEYGYILPLDLWKIVKNYLVSLEATDLDQAKNEAKQALSGIEKINSTEIIKRAQLDEQEINLITQSIKTLTEIESAPTYKKNRLENKSEKASLIDRQLTFYSTILSNVQRAQVLDEKSTLYCEAADNNLIKHCQIENNISHSMNNQTALIQLDEAKKACEITKAIKSKLNFFTQESLASFTDLRETLNKACHVEKNADCLKVMHFITTPIRRII